MQEKISVIVPVYRVERYLDKCIQSIVDQTYSNLEIILIDDGSPDRCPQICEEWSLRDSRIKVIHQENMGLSAARNAGIAAAQGKFLYFVDSDDWIDPTLCEKVMQAFSENEVNIVAFDGNKITESGKILGNIENFNEGILTTEDSLKALLQGHINNYVWNKIYKRSVFRDVWFPVGRAFEDMATTYKLFINADKIYYMNARLYYYLQRNNSITATIDSQKLCDMFVARQECYLNLKDLCPDIAELIYPRVVLCARHLYDRSLWETSNQEVLKSAVVFLRENKEKILQTQGSLTYRLLLGFPKVYNALRLTRYYAGNIVKTLRRKINH